MAKETLIAMLISSGAVSFGRFRLTSGALSPIYIDMRRALSFVDLRGEVLRAAIDTLRGLGFGGVAGVAVGGVPWASIMAHELGLPMIYVRSEAKSHGLGKTIEGLLEAGVDYLVVDDVATTGGSIEAAVRLIRGAGGRVRHAFVIVDRLQGASERLGGIGVDLLSLLTLRDIVDVGLRMGLISAEKAEDVYRYMGWERVER